MMIRFHIAASATPALIFPAWTHRLGKF